MLGTTLKIYRKSKKMTKVDLSKKTGLSARTIEYLEEGKIDNPTLKTLKSLAEALDISVGELVD